MSDAASAKAVYSQYRFVFQAAEPVHVGGGGFRLGRVDLPVAREPGTNLPKIPGTTLAGVARSYAALQYGKTKAAGQHRGLTDEEKRDCPIIYTFGTTREDGGQAGRVSIGDARLLLFPVRSVAGPVWVSTQEILEEAGFGVDGAASEDQPATTLQWQGQLNLSWMLFEGVTRVEVKAPPALTQTVYVAVARRIVLVTARLFEELVNSNLEVRTSVSISPETGAAEDKALFTYEALPRAAWLWADCIEDNYNPEARFPSTNRRCDGEPLGETWERPLDVVWAGLLLAERLGVGGMGTRGFGRLRPVANWLVGGAK